MTTHTPTPWLLQEDSGGIEIAQPSPPQRLLTTPQGGINQIAYWAAAGLSEDDRANAAHIVRCVNANDALVAALEATMSTMRGYAPDYEDCTSYQQAEAALRLAKGEK